MVIRHSHFQNLWGVMIQITDDLFIDSTEIREEFVRASGPGGQNVNKVASAVQLRFHVKNNRSLPADVRQRLIKLAGSALTKDGELILNSKRFRTQERNRKDAMEKLIQLVKQAAKKPKPHLKTKMPKASKLKRLEEKKHVGKRKQLRKSVKDLEE